MKTFALLFVFACSSVALLDNSAEAASPRHSFQSLNAKQLASPFRVKPGTINGLNPQPLPPRYISPSKFSRPGTLNGLNPQPLPPRWMGSSLRIKPGTINGLNPQPLPPRW